MGVWLAESLSISDLVLVFCPRFLLKTSWRDLRFHPIPVRNARCCQGLARMSLMHRTPLDSHRTIPIPILLIIAPKSLCQAGSSPIEIGGQARNRYDFGVRL